MAFPKPLPIYNGLYNRRKPSTLNFSSKEILVSQTRWSSGPPTFNAAFSPPPKYRKLFMRKTFVLWSDEAAGRLIKFIVDYSIDGDMLHVLDLTPTEVSIVDIVSLTVKKKIFVHTNRVQAILRSRFIDSGMLETLVDRIAKNHNLTVVTQNN